MIEKAYDVTVPIVHFVVIRVGGGLTSIEPKDEWYVRNEEEGDESEVEHRAGWVQDVAPQPTRERSLSSFESSECSAFLDDRKAG